MVGRLLSFWDGPFSGAFAVSFREGISLVLEVQWTKERFFFFDGLCGDQWFLKQGGPQLVLNGVRTPTSSLIFGFC